MSTAQNKLTVLLVDDDEDFLIQQKIQLEAAGFQVLSAHGQVKAEELLAQQRPDLAVVNLMMEHADGGFTLCHHIRKKDPSIPVILVSSVNNETGLEFDTTTDAERSWIKADAFLSKPIRFEQLKLEIDRLLPGFHLMDTLRVLVTDDELGMRLGVARTLRNFTVRVPDVDTDVSFVVNEADSGEAALEKIRRAPPDILLLDHKMPGISGLEVLDQLAGMSIDMLTIMITAYASIETAVSATKRAGRTDFLAKPFTPDELKSTIRKAAARLVLAKQARKLAEEKRQIRFEFIRVLGHELKAPLNAVSGYLELLQSHSLGPEVQKYDEMVARSLDRMEGMRKLIADLLDMTQIESGRKNRQLAAVNVAEIARAALDAVRPEAARQGVTVCLQDNGPVAMTADRREMEMIFNNLLSNAVKYNRPQGRVDVRLARSAAGQLSIRVADSGIGMTAEESVQLFDEFVRIKNDKTLHILGSGLGLSIVKKIALLYDGDATVESRPDAGSTFTVVLNDPTKNDPAK